MTNVEQLSQIPYRRELAATLGSEPNHAFRRGLLELVKNDSDYKRAKEEEKRRKLALGEIRQQSIPSVEDESSQAVPVVENSLLKLSPSENQLTEQAKTVLWANQVLEEYSNLPKVNNAERRKVKALLDKTASHLLESPQEIDSAASTWNSRTGEDQGGFYQTIKQTTSKQVEEKWAEIKPETVSEFLKVYANSVLAKDFTESLLSNYFRGPRNRIQKEEAYYKFMFSVLDLIDEPKALEEAVKIGLFETNILVRGSRFYLDHMLTSVIIPIDEKGERVLQQYLISNELLQDISVLTKFDSRISSAKDVEFSKEFIVPENSPWRVMISREMARAQTILGKAIIESKQEALLECQTSSQVSRTSQDIEKLKNKWPYNLFYDEKDPLQIKFSQVARDKIASAIFAKQDVPEFFTDGNFREYDTKSLTSLSVVFSNGLMMDVLIPQNLIHKRSEIIRNFLNVKFIDEELDVVREKESFFTSSRIQGFLQLEGFPPMWVMVRRAVGSERKQHSLQSLELIGFPNPRTEGDKDIGLANQELAEEIKRKQLRFLNKRGVRVPVKNTPFGDFGYSHIDF